MSEIEKGLLDAQDHFLRGVMAGNKTYARIAGQQLRQGNPEVINQFRKNLGKVEQLSNELEEKRAAASAQRSRSEIEKKTRK
ncbi:hypothetical protein [Pseudomonas sp. 58 R 3]|uniref:hypothetical protein n=1 Tax=Pseudomonas sp. 58 R 3 TaxID=1844108 RepID=UPI00111249A8|nr:hypothetical protein [Pseudomonas sp. 58 R 3]